MKIINYGKCILAAGTIALMAGCATSNRSVVLDPVGPAPGVVANPVTHDGTLVVYSAYDTGADFSERDARRPEYSDYRIMGADGGLLQRVHNNSGSIFQRPERVSLPAGTYRVVALANGAGLVTVPVSIVAGKDTVVHLEGGFNAPDLTGSNAVTLPDGEVVGWRGVVASQ